MRALSVRQPWAYLIVSGQKDVENRRWPTRVRGPILIHASMKMDLDGLDYAAAMRIPLPAMLQTGGIVGTVTLVDCLEGGILAERLSNWFTGPYGYLLCDASPLPFLKCPGRLRFFEVAYPLEVRR
jgi:hypothetical protein